MKSWLLCCCVSLLVVACQADPAPADAMSRPARPKSFGSPDDLRTYLDQLGQYYAVAGRPRPARPKSFGSPEDLRLYLDLLGQYYAVAGRPRFGKRTSSHPQRYHLPLEGLNLRYNVPDPSDIYDLLYQPLNE